MRRRSKKWNDGYAEDDWRNVSQPYDVGSAALGKWRFRARDGLQSLSRIERHQYGAAVEDAVLRSQNAWWKAGVYVDHAAPYPDIGETIRAEHRAALARWPGQERRARKPEVWRSMYEAAMADKRERLLAEAARFFPNRKAA